MHEMIDASILELVQKGLVAESISLSIGYARPKITAETKSSFRRNRLLIGILCPHRRHKKNRQAYQSARVLKQHFELLFNETTSDALPIRRISIGFGGLLPEKYATISLFDNREAEIKERCRQEAIIAIREKFGKNAMLKGISLQEKATARERNNQVGGHRAY